MWVPHVIWVFLSVTDKVNMPQILKICGFYVGTIQKLSEISLIGTNGRS